MEIRKLLSKLPYVVWPDAEFMSSPTCYPAYVAAAKAIKPRSILEIGAFEGFGLLSFVAGYPRVECLAWIDAQKYVSDSNEQCEKNLGAGFKMLGIKPVLTCYWESGDEFVSDHAFGSGEYDLIHVDAGHTYDECYSDLEFAVALEPRIILVDDYLYHTEVAEAVRDFTKEHQLDFFVWETYRGWAVIKLKPMVLPMPLI